MKILYKLYCTSLVPIVQGSLQCKGAGVNHKTLIKHTINVMCVNSAIITQHIYWKSITTHCNLFEGQAVSKLSSQQISSAVATICNPLLVFCVLHACMHARTRTHTHTHTHTQHTTHTHNTTHYIPIDTRLKRYSLHLFNCFFNNTNTLQSQSVNEALTHHLSPCAVHTLMTAVHKLSCTTSYIFSNNKTVHSHHHMTKSHPKHKFCWFNLSPVHINKTSESVTVTILI